MPTILNKNYEVNELLYIVDKDKSIILSNNKELTFNILFFPLQSN